MFYQLMGVRFLGFDRYPDEEAGQIPMAFVVRRPQSRLTQAQVMDFIAKQVICETASKGFLSIRIQQPTIYNIYKHSSTD